jgi:hypothetical protein
MRYAKNTASFLAANDRQQKTALVVARFVRREIPGFDTRACWSGNAGTTPGASACQVISFRFIASHFA